MTMEATSRLALQPGDGCVAADALANRISQEREDFPKAVTYLFGTARRSSLDHEQSDEIYESIEGNFGLTEGMGRLAWLCALCQSHGDICKKGDETDG